MSVTIIAKNQTVGDLTLNNISVPDRIIPGSGQVELTLWNTVDEIQRDDELRALVTAGDVIFNDGSNDLSGAASLQLLTPVTSVSTPPIAITDTFVVASEVAMLALDAQRGDVAVRTDLPDTYILQGDDPTSIGDWVLLEHPTDLVSSVNSQTGAVNLTATDVGAAPSSLARQTPRGDEILLIEPDGTTTAQADLPTAIAASSSGDIIRVGPGVFTASVTLPAGVVLEGAGPTVTEIVSSAVSNPAITNQGGSVRKLAVSGTNSANAGILCDVPASTPLIEDVRFEDVGYGIRAENGALVRVIGPSVSITAGGQAVGSLIYATGSGTQVKVKRPSILVPASVLPSYPGSNNPVNYGVEALSSAEVFVSDGYMELRGNGNNTAGLYADSGARIVSHDTDIVGAEDNLLVGSSGSGTSIIVQGGYLQSPVNSQVKIESATGSVVADYECDTDSADVVSGGSLLKSLTGPAFFRQMATNALVGFKESVGGAFPTTVTWWEDNTKTTKMVEATVTYAGAFITGVVYQFYDADGAATVSYTETRSYIDANLVSIERVVT